MRRPQPDTRLRGVLVLAACCGAERYLTTAEALNALVLALLLGCLGSLLVFFLPPSRNWRRAGDFYVLGAIVLVFPWLMLKIGYAGKYDRDRPAWHDLHARYPAAGSAPAGLEYGRDVVVSRVRSFRIRRYGYKHVAASFGDAGAYLGYTFPLSLLYDPVQVPVSGIWRCRKDESEPWCATLSIRDIEMEIRLPDEERRILAWCARQQIPEDEPRRPPSVP